MIGDASQNAMTAERGTPIASSAAINGMTPQEQNGDNPPASAPNNIINTGAPVKAFAIRLSAPVAPAHAAIPMDNKRYGAVCKSAEKTNLILAIACVLSKIASRIKIAIDTSHTA